MTERTEYYGCLHCNKPPTEHEMVCRITKVLDASRAFCYHATPENREALKQALEEYQSK